MKKFLIFLSCAAALCFASCANSDDGGDTNTGSPNGTDTTAPSKITELAASYNYSDGTIKVTWTNPSDSDFSKTLLTYTDNGATAQTVEVVSTLATYTFGSSNDTIATGETWTFYAVAKDTSGNKSDACTTVSITTADDTNEITPPSDFPTAVGTNPFAGKTILNYDNETELTSDPEYYNSILEFSADGTYTVYDENGDDEIIPYNKGYYSYDTEKKQIYTYVTYYYDQSTSSWITVKNYIKTDFANRVSFIETLTDSTEKENYIAYYIKEWYVSTGIYNVSEVINKNSTELLSTLNNSIESVYSNSNISYDIYSYDLKSTSIKISDSLSGYPLIIENVYDPSKKWYEQKVSFSNYNSEGKILNSHSENYNGYFFVSLYFNDDSSTSALELFTPEDGDEYYNYFFTTSDLPTEDGSSKELTVTSVWGDTKQVTVSVAGTGEDTQITVTASDNSYVTDNFYKEAQF